MQTRRSRARRRITDAAVMPLLVPSATGLANTGSGSSIRPMSAALSTSAKSGVGRPVVADDALGRCLVQRDGADQRIGKGVRDAVCVEDGWNERFAAEAVQALTDVEDQVPGISSEQPRDVSERAPPIRSTVCPSATSAASIASMVSGRSNSAVCKGE